MSEAPNTYDTLLKELQKIVSGNPAEKKNVENLKTAIEQSSVLTSDDSASKLLHEIRCLLKLKKEECHEGIIKLISNLSSINNPTKDGGGLGSSADKQRAQEKQMSEIDGQGTFIVKLSGNQGPQQQEQNMGQVDGKRAGGKSDENIHRTSEMVKISMQGTHSAPTSSITESHQTASGKDKAEGQQQQDVARENQNDSNPNEQCEGICKGQAAPKSFTKKDFSKTTTASKNISISDVTHVPIHEYEKLKEQSESQRSEIIKLEKDVKLLKETCNRLKTQFDTERHTKHEELKQKDFEIKKLEEEKSHTKIFIEDMKAKHARKFAEEQDDRSREIRDLNSTIQDLIKERDDIRDRFSRVAGSKLTDGNPDIADLSDPNRAMKVSERFGALYDDQWTDAFQNLTGKLKISSKDAITFLLQLLKDCFDMCTVLAQQQMDCLKNILLHPCQDVAKNVGVHVYSKDAPCIGHQELMSLKALRKAISKNVTAQVKTEIQDAMKNKYKQSNDKRLPECRTYLETCAEICWLMALNDPPLSLGLSAKQGDRMDDKIYSAYSATGDKIDYIVWPPLFNGVSGGLLSKGVVETIKSAKEKK